MLGLREVASEKFCVWVHLFRMISLPLVCPPDGPSVGRLCAPIFGEVRPTPPEVRLMCSDARVCLTPMATSETSGRRLKCSSCQSLPVRSEPAVDLLLRLEPAVM